MVFRWLNPCVVELSDGLASMRLTVSIFRALSDKWLTLFLFTQMVSKWLDKALGKSDKARSALGALLVTLHANGHLAPDAIAQAFEGTVEFLPVGGRVCMQHQGIDSVADEYAAPGHWVRSLWVPFVCWYIRKP
jgi:hypothetical protein